MKQKKNIGTVEYIFVRKRSRKFEKSRAVFSELLNRARAISKQGAPSNAIASGQNAPKALSAQKRTETMVMTFRDKNTEFRNTLKGMEKSEGCLMEERGWGGHGLGSKGLQGTHQASIQLQLSLFAKNPMIHIIKRHMQQKLIHTYNNNDKKKRKTSI